MAVDASIYGQLQQPKPVNALANMAAAYELQNAAQQNQLGQMKLDEANRSIAETNRLNQLYSQSLGADGSIDRTALYRNVASGGFGSKLPAIQKQFADQDKASADLDKTKLEATAKRVDLVGQGAKFVMDNPTPENANSAIDFWAQSQIITPQQAAQYKAQVAANPGNVGTLAQQLFRQSLAAKDQLAKFETRNLGGTTDTQSIDPVTGQMKTVNSVQNTQSPDSKASTGVQWARLNFEKEKDKRDQSSAGSGPGGQKAPAGFRWKPNGDLEPIPGGPGDKQTTATEGERKAATLLQRLEGSQSQLAAALRADASAAKPGLVSSAMRAVGQETVANTLTPEKRQQVEAAQLDILDAALTLGTGAAYTREQLEGYRRSYFPQIGDGAATIKDKQDRLNNVIQAAKIAAGRAAKNTGGATGSFAPAGGIDALLEKYK